MKLLLFSDLHRDLEAARAIVAMGGDADVAVCAGDLAVQRRGLKPVVEVLAGLEIPTVLVPGNGESEHELRSACAAWSGAHVLHGSGVEVGGLAFWGVGGGIPVTPFGSWSFDLDEEEASELLKGCPEGCVLVCHSPPFGHVDESEGARLGSKAVLRAIDRSRPELVVCGHIHSCWRQESRVGESRVVNAGPQGMTVEV